MRTLLGQLIWTILRHKSTTLFSHSSSANRDLYHATASAAERYLIGVTHSLRRAGFTLLELVVVIAILGVAFAVSIPSFTNRSGSGRADAADAITRLLERARNTAAEQARETRVTIAPAEARAWIRSGDVASASDTSFTLSLPAGTTLSATSPRVQFTFDASGRARGDQLIIDANGARSAITVDPSSGDVRVASNAKP
jgi:prepilin-type N-terminal cleavage/methylation domain-containing protein